MHVCESGRQHRNVCVLIRKQDKNCITPGAAPGVIWEIWEKEEYGAMNQSLVFKTEKVAERITRIYAFATELMYLVEGTEKAVLIDTGSGIGSLKARVEQLTDKPVIVLVTHGHVDHAMGAAEFENVYMSHEDDYIYEKHGTDAFRRSCFSTATPPFEAGEESFKALQEKVSGKYDNVLLSHGDGNGYPELIAEGILFITRTGSEVIMCGGLPQKSRYVRFPG